jgi:hypothetical protein
MTGNAQLQEADWMTGDAQVQKELREVEERAAQIGAATQEAMDEYQTLKAVRFLISILVRSDIFSKGQAEFRKRRSQVGHYE